MRAILHLGGNSTRIETTIEMVKQWPDALVILGTVENPVECFTRLRIAGVNRNRIIFDFRAWDTVTNFTVVRRILKEFKVEQLCIVTDTFHMRRSMLIARIVYFANSTIKEISAAYHQDPAMVHAKDTVLRTTVDVLRAVIWATTRILFYNPRIKAARMPSIAGYEATYKWVILNQNLTSE